MIIRRGPYFKVVMDYLHARPLLRFSIVMVLGIVVGRHCYVPISWRHIAMALLAVLLVAALMRMKEAFSSLLIHLAAFLLGLFLITHSDLTPSHTYPIVDRVGCWMEEQRATFLATYLQNGITGEEYSIVAAMTLGERRGIAPSLRQQYNISGAAHVFALSGMHLGIIYMIITLLLRLSGLRRFPVLCSVVTILMLWLFVLLVGFHPSVLRAAVMLTVYSLCTLMTRKPTSVDVLILTAFLLLVIHPQWLFDVGFQMSFCAVISIILLYSPLMAVLPDRSSRVVRYLMGIVLLTFTANLGVTPLILHYFGSFSVYSLLANIPISLSATLILSLSLLLLLLSPIVTLLPLLTPLLRLVAWCLSHVVWLQNTWLTWVASLPGSYIDGFHINVPQTLLLYILITSSAMLFYILRFRRLR